MTVVEDLQGGLDEVRRDIMWNRLIAVVEEQATTLVRSAFSTSTREAGDLSAGVFDPSGRMLAQSVTGTPGHVNSMAASVLHFLDAFPVDTMEPGDVFLTNDPWKGTGHLFDVVVLTPVFRNGAVVALFACTSHVVDIGGMGFTTDSKEIYHEGLRLPLLRFARRGEFDPNVVAIVEANVRDKVQVIGDIHSLVACNETGARRLLAMMDEYGLDDLDDLAAHVIGASRAAMLAAVRALPRGTWTSAMRVDGMTEPIDIVATLTVSDDGIDVDFTGTGPQVPFGINVPLAYTVAYTSFGVRCIVGPEIPNNSGSLGVVRVSAPEGCILNAPHPAAVNVRHVMGQMLPDAVFGCLAQAVPERVPAEGTSSLWNLLATGPWDPVGAAPGAPPERFIMMSFHSGGAGARPDQDGLSATAFPSGVRNMPVEINELVSPLVFWRKEFRPGSGGTGRYRGGLGQVIELANRQGRDFTISATYERVVHPARGRDGGGPGARGSLTLDDGTPVPAKGLSTVAGDRRLIVSFPGGGGHGDPARRDPAAVERDRLHGLD
jgi:N-methylhydantoinase B